MEQGFYYVFLWVGVAQEGGGQSVTVEGGYGFEYFVNFAPLSLEFGWNCGHEGTSAGAGTGPEKRGKTVLFVLLAEAVAEVVSLCLKGLSVGGFL